jgi:hypothetical protein
MFPTSLSQAPKPDSGEAGKAVLRMGPSLYPFKASVEERSAATREPFPFNFARGVGK